MKRELLVVLPALPEGLRARVRGAAEERGFSAAFFASAQEAMPFAGQAEVLLSDSLALAKAAEGLRWLCTPSAGVERFCGEEMFCSGRVLLSNSSGAYGVTIAEHIVMVTLEMMRCRRAYAQIVQRREWRRNLPICSIKNCRVTLLGTGDIGCEAARRLRAFGPACLIGVNRSGRNPGEVFDRVIPEPQMDAVLPETDLLIVSLPGTAETWHLLSAQRLALLPEGAMIVNVGRGSVMDQAALEKELRAGRLQAALDVFEQEPIPAEDPIWECPNLLITPHMSGNMTLPYTVERIIELFLEDLDNYCAGRPLQRRVDPLKGY